MTPPGPSSGDSGDDLGQIHGPAVPPSKEPDDKTLREQFDYEHKAHVAALKGHLEELRKVLKDVKTERNKLRKDCDVQRKELDSLRPDHAVVKRDYQVLVDKNNLSDWLIATGTACFGINSFSFITAKIGFFVAGTVFTGCGYYYKYFAIKRKPKK